MTGIHSRSGVRWLFSLPLLMALMFLFVSGCGQEFNPVGEGGIGASGEQNFSTPIPGLIGKQKHLIEPGRLTAEVVIDGDKDNPTPLAVNLAEKTVSGTIEDLFVGNHTFAVNYYINGVSGHAVCG